MRATTKKRKTTMTTNSVAIMLSPITFKSYIVSSGNVYTADQYGIIPNVTMGQDVTDLTSAGCTLLNPSPTNLLGKLIGANFNSAADQQIPCLSQNKARVTKITVTNASISLTTAAGGIYQAAAKAGSPLVASGQAYSALTGALLALDLTLALPSLVLAAGFSPLYLSLTTAQGAAATADVYVWGDQYTQ
jgi:hypothetical protein